MAVPRLRDERAFRRLDPDAIDEYDAVTTVGGIDEYGDPVGPEGMETVDLIVSGSVAVAEDGGRVGKGEGFSDLEFAVLAELGAVDGDTLVATTVHERQVLGAVPHEPHDVPIDLVATPERAVETETSYDRPTGVDWSLVDDDQARETPVLSALRPD